jgi:hypothetical protein
VIELSARLRKGGIDASWLPKHTYIVLSQIQGHAAGVLEDLDREKPPPENELEAMDNSLDSMIETYEDIKDLIDEALDRFRHHNLSVVKPGAEDAGNSRMTVQISIGGTYVWRRVLVPTDCRLLDMHSIIQSVLGWKDSFAHRFSVENANDVIGTVLDEQLRLDELNGRGVTELNYDYGTKWTVKVIVLSRDGDPGETVRCAAGVGAAPPEFIDGPLRFRKILHSMESGGDTERSMALNELGPDFNPDLFDLETCNRNLISLHSIRKRGQYEKRK